MVVDNNSTDGSFDYLQPRFPWVKFILNKTNEGFSKANNLALFQAKSTYVLFLNPDTILAEDSIEKCISFFETHPEAGAVGVKMINGLGEYLKESKRGFPSPWVSFCKLSGLAALFPHSKIFAGYYLGHLKEKENQIIDAISGACMFTRKVALEKTGNFDEQFFMYAEDIDLSYRIQAAGYVNYYLAETTVIHFKGESTKKDAQHVKLFYGAMNLFAKKHFSNSPVFTKLIEAGIWFRGIIAAIWNFFSAKHSYKKNIQRIFLKGDAQSIAEVEKMLADHVRLVTKNESEADTIILCEGKTFSFKKIIETISLAPKKNRYVFHAFNSFFYVQSKEYKTIRIS